MRADPATVQQLPDNCAQVKLHEVQALGDGWCYSVERTFCGDVVKRFHPFSFLREYFSLLLSFSFLRTAVSQHRGGPRSPKQALHTR